jgi:hypothetical protein
MTTPTAPADTTPVTGAPASPATPSAPIVHIGLFFVRALVVLAVGTVKLWREQR